MARTRSRGKRGKEPVVSDSGFDVVEEAGMIADEEEGESVGRRLKQKSPAKKKTKKENPGATKKKTTFSVDDGVHPDSDFDMGGLDGKRSKSSPTKNKSKLKSKSSLKRKRTKVEFASEDCAYSKKGKMLDEIELKDYALQGGLIGLAAATVGLTSEAVEHLDEGGARGKASRQSKFSGGSFFTTTTGSVPPVTNSRVSPLPPEPGDFYNPTAPIDIPVDSAVDFKKKARELQTKKAELKRREQVMASSSTERPKIKISFYINGNPVGSNKAKLMRRTLALAKSIVGLKYDDWRTVPSAVKDDLWNTLLLDFDLKNGHKETLLSQASGQWKTWKKNLRKRTFGDTATSKEILQLRDKPPEEESIPHVEWNLFVDREADPKKLEQRAKNKANRAKKTGVHLFGTKSYAQVNAEWQERTKGTKNEGLTPSRKKKFGEYHSGFAAKLSERRETEGGDIDTVPLSQVFGKNKCGRTRGVGGKVSRTKYKGTQLGVSEIDQMKSEIQVQGSKIDTILGLLQGRPSEDMEAPSSVTIKSIAKKPPSSVTIKSIAKKPPSSGTIKSIAKKPSTIGEGSSMCPKSNDNSPLKAHKGYYHIRDLKNEQNIAMAKIETVEPGTVVHSRPLKYPEAKVIILAIYPNMENEPVYLGQQGCATCLGDYGEGSFITWPIYLLKEMT